MSSNSNQRVKTRFVDWQFLSHLDGALPCWMVKAAMYHNPKQTYTEDDVQAGHCSNVSLVADKFGVKRGTLRNRLRGTHGPASHSQQQKQHLTDTKENVLCDWIEH